MGKVVKAQSWTKNFLFIDGPKLFRVFVNAFTSKIKDAQDVPHEMKIALKSSASLTKYFDEMIDNAVNNAAVQFDDLELVKALNDGAQFADVLKAATSNAVAAYFNMKESGRFDKEDLPRNPVPNCSSSTNERGGSRSPPR